MLLGLAVLLEPAPAGAAAGDQIRVAVIDGAPVVELGGGPISAVDLQGRRLWRAQPSWIRVLPRADGMEVRAPRLARVRTAGLRAGPVGRAALRVNTREYGDLVEVRRGPGGLLVVNELGLEDYLPGVLKAEAGEDMPLEMLKAQAIVARTFAAYHRNLNAAKPYHLSASTAHQQYLGRVGPSSPAWRASRETAGQVLLWQEALFPAFYHTDSGGHTEDPRVVFGADNMPALHAVPVEFASESPHGEWTLELPLSRLATQLQRGGLAVGQVIGLEVLERSASLRVDRLAVRGTRGRVVLLGNEFRRLVGYDTLKSTLFTVDVDGAVARFSGRGYGHGVGMDQSRARTMADLGYQAPAILAFYYPGSVLTQLWARTP